MDTETKFTILTACYYNARHFGECPSLSLLSLDSLSLASLFLSTIDDSEEKKGILKRINYLKNFAIFFLRF
jgi:hypothetical protein